MDPKLTPCIIKHNLNLEAYSLVGRGKINLLQNFVFSQAFFLVFFVSTEDIDVKNKYDTTVKNPSTDVRRTDRKSSLQTV